MSLGKAIAEAIAGGIAGYATAETGTDFINPLLRGQQAAQDRKAKKAESLAEREFKADQAELARAAGSDEAAKDRKQRAELQRTSQEFQADQARLQREFETGLTVFRETGDMSALASSLDAVSGTGNIFTDITNRVLTATKAVHDRDQRGMDSFREQLAAKIKVAEETARTSPTQFLERVRLMREGAKELLAKASESFALETNQSTAAEHIQAYLTQLDSFEQGAQEAALGMAVEAGEYKALADEGTSTKTRRAVISRRYGKDSTQQQAYDVSNTIVGYLENFTYTNLSDIEDPAVREIVGMLRGEGDDAALASLSEQLGRNLSNAPALAEAIDNVQIGDVQNALSALQRTETKRDFGARVSEAATGAGDQLDIDLDLPDTAFIMDDAGQMVLSATGAVELATAFEGATGAAENPTLEALRAVDQVAARAGWDEGTIAATKRAIAQDYEFIEDLALTYENPAEVIGKDVEAGFNTITPKALADIEEGTSGLSDAQARDWMRRQGFNPAHLELVREGGSVYGREIVRSVLPNSAAASSLMKDIQDELTIAVAAGDEDQTTGLTQQLELLQSVAADPAVTNMAEMTMFDAARAVAHGDLEGFYDRVTAKAPAESGFNLNLEGSENKQRDEFIEYVNQGATEGAKVRRALEYMSAAGAFQLGVRTQPTSTGQQQFNSYIAAYADDYGARLDDVIASMDLGANFRVRDSVFRAIGGGEIERRPSNVALRYITSAADEVDKFYATNTASRRERRNPVKPEI